MGAFVICNRATCLVVFRIVGMVSYGESCIFTQTASQRERVGFEIRHYFFDTDTMAHGLSSMGVQGEQFAVSTTDHRPPTTLFSHDLPQGQTIPDFPGCRRRPVGAHLVMQYYGILRWANLT